MQSERARNYVIHGLRANPIVFARLLEGVSEEELDMRPDPERFTLREVLCHLADWEPIWLDRIRAIAEQDNPLLPGYDEGQMAIDHHYDQANATEQLERFRAGRTLLADYIATLPVEAWTRRGTHAEAGTLVLSDLVTMILGHDGYHARQMVEHRQ